jgi:N-methylhydantoinase B
MPSTVTALLKGDRFCHIAAGGAGHGDPLMRSPQAVREDVLDDRITVQMAREVYGVVLEGAGRDIDAQRTAEMRGRLQTLPGQERVAKQEALFLQSTGADAAAIGKL